MSPQARKRFGQHFLEDKQAITAIINAVAPDRTIPIVEIGPGRGALTAPLLRAAGQLDVIEIDTDLANALEQKCAGLNKLIIHRGDALDFNFRDLYKDKIKVVGNLPYNISTPLLFHLLEQIEGIREMVFMMQKEVIDRLCADKDCKAYGRLSVMVQAQCELERLMTIGPEAFHPPPKVDSSVIRLRPMGSATPFIKDPIIFGQIVKHAFNQRRKTVRNSLADYFQAEELHQLGIDPSSRAENLSVADYVFLANHRHRRICQ